MSLESLRYITVEGVIGAGKTSLTARLAQTLSATAIYEEFEKNPFLDDFYQDPERYAFQTQIFFLMSRYKQQQQFHQHDLFHECIVSDYLFSKDRIFATLNLNEKEIKLYDGIARLMEKDIVKPDLVLYLQASTKHLLNMIQRRGRKMERFISEDYIQALNDLYNNFFFHYSDTPLLVINTDEIDFVHNEKDYKDILFEINQHTSGTRYYIPQKI
jgi:deoxyadenosine/deoxycytidine kinase